MLSISELPSKNFPVVSEKSNNSNIFFVVVGSRMDKNNLPKQTDLK
jgi:hypothetical protein